MEDGLEELYPGTDIPFDSEIPGSENKDEGIISDEIHMEPVQEKIEQIEEVGGSKRRVDTDRCI